MPIATVNTGVHAQHLQIDASIEWIQFFDQHFLNIWFLLCAASLVVWDRLQVTGTH